MATIAIGFSSCLQLLPMASFYQALGTRTLRAMPQLGTGLEEAAAIRKWQFCPKVKWRQRKSNQAKKACQRNAMLFKSDLGQRKREKKSEKHIH